MPFFAGVDKKKTPRGKYKPLSLRCQNLRKETQLFKKAQFEKYLSPFENIKGHTGSEGSEIPKKLNEETEK